MALLRPPPSSTRERPSEGASDGSSLSNHRQGPDGGQQCFAREQPHQAAVSAQSAAAALLARDRESLDHAAPYQCGAANNRQERHRGRAGRIAIQGLAARILTMSMEQ